MAKKISSYKKTAVTQPDSIFYGVSDYMDGKDPFTKNVEDFFNKSKTKNIFQSKEDEKSFWEQQNIIASEPEQEKLIAQKEEELKYQPKNAVEQTMFEAKDFLGVDFKKYIDTSRRIEELENKRTTTSERKKAEEWSNKYSFNPVSWINRKYREGREYLDEAFTASAKNLDNPYLGTSDNLAGLTKDETREYYELLRQKREAEKPLAKLLLEDTQNQLKKSSDLKEGQYDSSKGMVYVTPDDVGFFGKAWNVITDSPAEGLYLPESMLDPSSITESKWGRKQAKVDRSTYNQMSSKYDAIGVKRMILEKQSEILDKFINDKDSLTAGLGVVSEDLGTFGMYSIVEKIILGKIQDKKFNGEKISPEEEEALKAYNLQQSVSQLDVSKGRFLYRTGEGAGRSAVFLEQTGLTLPVGGIGGAATKALTTPLTNRLYMGVVTGALGNLTKGELAILNGINLVEKGLIGSGSILSQSLAMGNTYDQALDKYIGQTQSVIDKDGNEKILTTNSEREATLKEINNELILNNNERKKLSNSTRSYKEDRLAQLDERDKYLKQTINSLYDPTTGDVIKDVGAFDAFLYGYVETIKELAAEKYVGELGGKIFNPVGKYISNKTAVGQKILSPIGNVANKFWSKGQDLVNRTSFGKISQNALYHTGTANLWHGLPGEILEEIAVQLTPSYQDNWIEAWKEQIGELKDPTFYLDVAAQTILMGIGFSSVGTSQHLTNYLTNKEYRQQNKEDRNNRKKIKELYRDIDKSVNNEQLANYILMNTGGTVFEISDYQAQITSLRDQGKNEEADKLEKKSFLNIAINSLKTGTLDRFERSIEKISSNPNLSEETRKNAITALQYIPELKKLNGEYSGMLNKQELIGLAANKILQRETLKEIDKKLSSLDKSVVTEIDKFKRYNNIENDYSLTDFMAKMKTDEDGQYKSFIDNLRKENSPEINQYLDLMAMKDLYENLEYRTTKEINTKTSKKHQEDLAKKYRKALKDVVANTVDKDNIESSKTEVIQELTEEEVDAELIAKMNAKAIDSAGQVPAVNKTTSNKEKVVIPLTTDDNLSSFFDDTPVQETSTDKGNNAVSASDLFDDFEEATPTNLTPEEQAGIDALNQGLYSPINYNPANEKQTEFVDNLSKGFEKLHKKHPQMDFDGLIASLRSAYSGRNVEQRFNFARAAWEKATGENISDTEAQKVYNDNFADVTDISEINSAFGGATPSINDVSPDDIKKSDEAGESNRYEYNPETNQEEKIEYAPHTERKYAGVGLKLGGVLGLNYEETDDGKVTITNQVNETAKPFMDWRNFKPGDTVEFVFDMDYLLNPNNMMPIWDNLNAENKSRSDERPVKRLVSVRERLAKLFKDNPALNSWDKIVNALEEINSVNKKIIDGKATQEDLSKLRNSPLFQNQEFLKIAPIGTVNKGYVTDNKEDGTPADSVLMGGLNDYYWINNANLALKINKNTGEPLLIEREIRLKENRRINLEARNAILQGGKLSVTVSEKRDARNNTRILKNEEERTQGYTNEYHSVLSQFANNIMEFQKNATIAYLDASDNFVGSVNNSGDKVFAKIDGKPIKKENIINYQSYIENAKKKGFDNGRTVFIHKAGVNSLGEPIYLVHDVINNHKTKQDTFKKTREILDRLYFKLAIQNNDSANQRAEKEALQKEFKKQFGYEFTKGIKVDLEGVYPKPHLVNNKKSGLFRQDFSAEAQTPGLFNNIPDLSRFETAEEFLEALKSGQEIPSVNKTEYMLNNLHTNLVFTPIEKNGETIYSHHSQPFMMFDFENNTPNQEQIIEENKKRLELRKKFLEAQIDKTSNKDEKAELNKELKEIKNELAKENIQQAAQETLKEVNSNIEQQKADIERINQVEQLFESNPELANAVYEALGFGQENNDEINFNDILKSLGLDNLISVKTPIVISEEEGGLITEHGKAQGKRTIYNEGILKGSSSITLSKDATLEVLVHELLHDYFNSKYKTIKNETFAKSIFNTLGKIAKKDSWLKRVSDTYGKESYNESSEELAILYLTSKEFRDSLPEAIKNKIERWLIENNIVTQEELNYYLNLNLDVKIADYKTTNNNQTTSEQKQQALEAYSQYLDTIFPDSKVKDIVYHGTNLNFDKFDKDRIGSNTAIKGEKPSFSFSNNREQAEAYSSEITVGQNTNELAGVWFEENQHIFKNGDITTGVIDENNVIEYYKKELENSKEMVSPTGEIDPLTNKYKLIPVNNKTLKQLAEIKTKEWQKEYNTLLTVGPRVMSVIIDVKNPKIVDFKGEKKSIKFKEEQKNTIGDAFIAKNIDDWGKGDTIQVFEPEQIHILGSKQDIEGFKEFINDTKLNNTEQQSETEFTDNDKFDVIEELIGRAFSDIDVSQPITVQDIYKLVENQFNQIVKELKDSGRQQEAQHILDNRDAILGIGIYEDSVREYINSMLDITEIEEFLDLTGENVKEHGQSSFEVDITKSLSFKTKVALSNIKDRRQQKGFANFEKNLSLTDVFNALKSILSDTNNNSIEDLERVIAEKVSRNPVEFDFFNQILERLKSLKKTNPEIINEILYNLYQSKVDMKFIMWRINGNGIMTLENYDANVKNPLFIKRSAWTEALKRNGLIDLYEGNNYTVNQGAFERAEKLHTRIFEEYDKSRDITSVNKQDLKRLLHLFGITLNDKTIENIYNQKSQNDLDVAAKLLDGKNSILNVLFENLKTAKNEEKRKLTFDNPVSKKAELRKFNILTNRNSQINDLIKADNFVEFQSASTMYLAGKTINITQQHNAITNKIKNLTQALKDYIANMDNDDVPDAVKLPGILSEFKNSPLTSNSFLLGLLERNPQKAVKYLDSFLISLEALKRSGDKSRDDMGMTNLSDKDAFVTLLGMFASSEGEFTDREIESTYDKKIKLRKGVINFPTISDSSQLPFLKTILIEMSNENVDLESSQLDESILSILREQLLIADLNRIADYIAKVGDSTSNLDGYDAGAIWITGLSSLNTVQVPYNYEANGETINTKRPLIYVFRDFIAQNKENNNPKAIQEFVNLYIKEINTEINNNVNHEVDKLITSDLKSGSFVDFELMNRDGLNLNDGKEEGYFYKKPARLVAYDYVVNNLIQQKEIQTIFAGDIALYFKNKMETGLKHGLPAVEFKDVVNFHYNSPGELSRIRAILKDRKPEDLTAQEKAQLISEFPELAYTDELITANINHEEAYNKLLPVASAKVMIMFKDVQNNLSKRLKGQISPGSQLPNNKNSPAYIQIMVSDVENSSETIEDMIQRNYPDKYESLLPKVREFKALDNLYNRTSDQNKRHKELKSELDKAIPKISAYLKTASTDAQEYTSWRENLNQLRSQGRITPAEYTLLESKLLAQTEDLKNGNFIKEENKLTEDEMKLAIMQSSKPLYSGMVNQNVNNTGHNVQRYVYIKSSSFPLLPELTQMFPKLNNLRKTIDKIEDKEKTTVRVSYQSANKVGAVKNTINVSELYKDEVDIDNILKSSIMLSRDNFYIQQDKPFKSDKNAAAGKPDRTTRATQFEKIILGDGINKMGYEFPSEMFDQDLLNELGIEKVDDKIDGPALKKIYNNLYEKEQKMLSDKLFNKLGIDKYSDIQEGKPEVMENLVKLLNRRLSNKQDKKALDLLYKVEVEKNGRKTIQTITKSELVASGLTAQKAIFKIPLFMTPNSRKFESVLNSVINKNNINLEMPGFSFPVASQEGFDYKGYSEEMYSELKEKGLIVSPDFDPAVGLKSTRDALTGELKYAQVFLANKYKVYNPTTGEYDYIDLTKYVDENNTIDLTKLPKDLLSMFSFRIPTSSHQSGTVIEVAGFLPHNMGDLMIVPKDHTVQIGEDYDIDVRYAYQYNYIEDENGNIKKLEYSDIVRPDKSIRDLRNDYDIIRRQLWDDYYQNKSKVDTNAPLEGEYETEVKNPYLEQNRNIIEEIVRLEDALDNYEIDKLVHAIFKDQYEVDKVSKEFLRDKISELESQLIPRDVVASEKKKLQNEYKQMKFFLREAFQNEKSDLRRAWNTYRNAYNQKGNELKVIENNLVAMYKSVFSSTNPEVQNLITKVLSTDFSEQSASEIDSRLSQQEPYFNIYAPSVQRKVMKLGADGKMGIGGHSNAVTMNSLLQQLDTPLQFIHYWDDKRNMNIPYNIILGNNVFDGVLGKITDGKRRLSEYLMESQNSATDNQKLEIMGRRNENAETISVFSLLQMSGLEDDGILVNGKELSYASLFISQPVLLEYVDTIKKYKSSTNKSYGNPEILAEEDLRKKYLDLVPDRYWQRDKKGKVLKGIWDKTLKDELAKGLNSKFLFDQLRPLGQTEGLDMAAQYYILDNFIRLKKPARQLSELQQFVNIENGGLGISYFDVIGLKDKIKQINSLDITTVDRIMTDDFTGGKKSLFSEMFGDMVNVVNIDAETIANLEKDGYIFIDSYAGIVDGESYSTYVKPTNHYSHKIMNSISLGYNLWNSLFPYDHRYIEQQIDSIVYASGVNPDSRRALELKYDIISNMKDYSYTNSRVLFGNNIEKYQKEIFFDDKANGQESLGSYLMRLKNNPDFAYLFNQPFFKDLQIDVNEKTYPTIIKYNTGDISPINNLKMYNRLSKLVDSDKKLPNKLNGKEMTESELMKELLMYSLLADQGNGAIGFRQLLPLSLFEKYKVDAMLRNRNGIDNQEMTNFVYNGPTKAAESFMRNTMDEEGVIRNSANIPVEQVNTFLFKLNSFIKAETGETNVYTINSNGDIKFNNYQGEIAVGSFIRQYFQHNPDKISTPIRYSEDSNSKLQDVLKENNISLGDFNEGKMTSFSLANYNRPFVVIEGKDGTIQLFERYDSVITDTTDVTEVSYYRRIPTLGVFGFNEYQANKSVSTSKVENNNFDTSWKNTPINVKKTVNYLNKTSLDTIVDTMINDYSGPYSALLTALREFIPDLSNVKVRTASDLAGKASYENKGEQIYITVNEKFLNNENTDAKAIQDAIIEELLHHVTVSTINDYVSFTGISDRGIQYTVKKDKDGKDIVVPAPLQTLLSVYGKAVQHYIAKHGIDKLRNQVEEFRGKVQGSQNSSIFTEDGLTEDAYRSMNIHEFIAGIFIRDTEFANEMANTSYMQSGKSILAKFSESLAKFFHRIIPGAKKTSISANVATALFDFLQEHHNTPNNKLTNIKKQTLPSNKTVLSAKALIDELNQDVPGEIPSEDKNTYRGVPVIDSADIINAEGQRGAAQYNRANNVIKVDRPLLQQKFKEKAWTKMRELVEIIHGDESTIDTVVKSKAKDLPANLFQTYEQFEAFVIEHEYQHSVYSRQDFDNENPGKTKGDYETAINERAILALKKNGTLNNTIGVDNLFSPNSVSLSNPITNVKLNCK